MIPKTCPLNDKMKLRITLNSDCDFADHFPITYCVRCPFLEKHKKEHEIKFKNIERKFLENRAMRKRKLNEYLEKKKVETEGAGWIGEEGHLP